MCLDSYSSGSSFTSNGILAGMLKTGEDSEAGRAQSYKGFVRPTLLKDCRGVFHLWSSSIAFSGARL